MSHLRREVRVLTLLATPVALTQLSSMLLWTIDFLMVGRIGVQSLNAVSLGRIWIMGTSMVALGLVFGLDPITSQAHGARDRERLGESLLHGAALALLVTVPLALAWLSTGPVLLAFGQDPATVALAAQFVHAQIPALPFFLLFMVIRQYLQARGIVRPAMWISFGANALNALLDWLLIFGVGGLPRLGALGAGVATAITQVAMLAALLWAIRYWRLQRGSRTILDLRAVRRHGIAEIARLGAPIALQIALEYWAFALAALWAGRLGPIELAAHSIVLNLASISYMVPLGISAGATTRVGQRIGAGDPHGAERAAWIAFALGAATMLGFAALFVLLRHWIPLAYTADPGVILLAAALLPIVAAFELFDGLQVVGAGILRGMGETRPAALANFVGYYVLGLPLAWWLSSRAGLGLAGIWWGLALGLFVVALFLVARVAIRGPRHARGLVTPRSSR
jgi:MATE family multidrug resistance protein